MYKIALFEPEIPQNTGNIARTCAGTGVELIIIGKPGFSLSDKQLKRAGLDYWEYVSLRQVENFENFESMFPYPVYNYALITKFGSKDYTYIDHTKDTILIFGSETSGLPPCIREKYPQHCYKIPINNHIRSLNLSNSVAIVLYDLLRKNGFQNLNGYAQC
jgi:tRNA (cytidine/uridine-2'-O-)-methyltransferase